MLKYKKILLAALIIVCVTAVPGYNQMAKMAAGLAPVMTLVIDVGHGGQDSGAVGADGTVEKNINLAIGKALKEEAEKYGVEVIMTREKDEGLYFAGDGESGRWSKLGDMKERKRIIDEADPELTVSIHLNSFKQDSRVRGAQVFYPKSAPEQTYEENKVTAEEIQESLKNGINDGTDRVVLPKDDMYLFKNNDKKIILVECGFLSNPDDLNNLKSAEFQQKIALCIMEAIAEHYSLTRPHAEKNNVIDSRTD